MYQIWESEHLKLKYRLEMREIKHAVITEAECSGTFAKIPDELEKIPVAEIGKKAFLGSKAVRIVLPASVYAIGDWAFAGCKKLEEIWIPKRVKNLGKELFLKSDKLKKIYIYSEQPPEEKESGVGCHEGIAELLACSVMNMKSYALFGVQEIGSRGWYEKWDDACMRFLTEPDETGFSPILAGGEEDYITNENDVRYHCHKRRMEKAELVYQRLRYSEYLSETYQTYYRQYLNRHNYGGQYDEAWQFLKQCREAQTEYYRIYEEAGCINEENAEALIRDLGETNTELKVLIMRYQSEQLSKQNFFEQLLGEV